jgi:TetR/AcrR family transcriptional repressor of mexJK operon
METLDTLAPAPEPPPSRKRQQMLLAAAELFIAQGYGAVSMDAVARAAGVSKATLYAHFASKDALFATIVGEACRASPAQDGNFPETPADLGVALRALGGAVLRFLLNPRTIAIARVAIAESARFPELGAAFLASGPMAFQARFAAWVATLHAAGRLDAPDATTAAGHLGALLRGSLHIEALLTPGFHPSEERIDQAVDAAVAVFLRAYGRT